MTVVLDPGHGGRDPGAVWSGVTEKELNLRIALRLEKHLKSSGFRVVLTRRTDVSVSLARRVRIANRYRRAIFVSIHCNASTTRSASGLETFYCSPRGCRIAQLIQGKTLKLIVGRNRGIKSAKFTVLTQTVHPAVLVECGFMSNRAELKRLRTSSHCDSLAKGIYGGILSYDG